MQQQEHSASSWTATREEEVAPWRRKQRQQCLQRPHAAAPPASSASAARHSAGAAAANVTLLPPADCFCSAPAAEVLAAFIAEDGSEDAEGGVAVAATVVVGRVVSVVAATASPLAVPAGSAAELVPALSRAAAASFAA